MFYLIVTYLIVFNVLKDIANAKLYVKIVEDGEKTTLDSYMYYNSAMQNITNQLRFSNREYRILRTQLGNFNIKLDKGIEAQETQLTEIKKLLQERPKTPTNITSKLPTSCAEALESKNDHTPGRVYRLHLPDMPPFDVYCQKDMDNGAAWTIIQRRQDGSIDFNRDWTDYKYGFGNVYGEYWLGLDKIYALTKIAKQELWILLEDFKGEIRHAKYGIFVIGSEKSKYTLFTLGSYSGDAGEHFQFPIDRKFTTKDNDNDGDNFSNCAITHSSGWWFHKCSSSNLNGKYIRDQEDAEVKEGKGITWYAWHRQYSLKHVHMALRPVK